MRPYTPDVLLEGGESIEVAGSTFDVLSVPGHSPAHLAYHADGSLFAGDVLFAGSVGRTDLPGADWETLIGSIRSLVDTYPPETVVYPGHGPATTLGARARPQPVPRRPARGAADVTRGPKVERPRGTHDVLPAEQPLWRRVVTEAEALCDVYGYRPIVTPVFEDTALFERTSGAGSDVVQKEMYTFEDRSGRSLTLRPEATAPICRAYVEHGLHREPQPVKLYTIAPMYRYSAPQRGRFREHWQLSVEAIGTDDPAIDAEVIELYHALLGRLGITEFRLALNSIGCRECRPAYVARLREWLDEEPRPPRRRNAGEGRREPAARLRQHRGEAGRRPRGARGGADDRRLALRRVPRALRRRSRASRRVRRRVRARTDARPRARLLHADDVGVQRAGRGSAEHALRRRPLRRPRRGDRRSCDARRRLRRGNRAAPARARGRRSHRGAAERRRLLRARGRSPTARGRVLALRAAQARRRGGYGLRGTVA